MADKLGSPKTEGTDSVAGKEVPAIYFGSTKINNNNDLVDEVAKRAGGTATIFVKSGGEYVRVATNVKKDDGSRAIGTVLDPKLKYPLIYVTPNAPVKVAFWRRSSPYRSTSGRRRASGMLAMRS